MSARGSHGAADPGGQSSVDFSNSVDLKGCAYGSFRNSGQQLGGRRNTSKRTLLQGRKVEATSNHYAANQDPVQPRHKALSPSNPSKNADIILTASPATGTKQQLLDFPHIHRRAR